MPKSTPAQLLKAWLSRRLPDAAWRWLDEQLHGLEDSPGDRDLYLAVSLVPRKVGKDDLRLAEAELIAAEQARPGWRPRAWSVDQAARILLLLGARGKQGDCKRWLDQLCMTADVGELVAFYRGLPLYPDPADHLARAMEGARSNMKAVFEAVAHENPYPCETFDENAWNHLVLKALFIGSALDPIQGLEERANPELMRMACDYADERRAAGREVSPELWRCVGPFADDRALKHLERLLKFGALEEQQAAALALRACPADRGRVLLAQCPDLVSGIESGRVRWQDLSMGRPGIGKS